ncbi:unnamed protein product [Tetraodon nigroviridis]|uniref:(spotted green pufferfish) hypothetical protein n=1 Tax=Tetraodon nigroviridis TaxID=99883 RepID=Q4SY74_TETNG|nr:unnamed protein product [Tetraodon nigroviridis]
MPFFTLLKSQVDNLKETEEEGDASNGLHEHHENRLLRGSGHEAVHHVRARLSLALVKRFQAVSVQDVLTHHEADLHHRASYDVGHFRIHRFHLPAQRHLLAVALLLQSS